MADEPVEHKSAKVRMYIAPESFADVIFGLALSIGSLVLIQNQVRTSNDFVGNIFIFAFSFLIIAMTWVLFSRTVSQLSKESTSVLLLNLALFFCVALEPYLFYLLWNNSPQIVSLQGTTSAAYALDVGFMFIILATLAVTVTRQSASGRKDLPRDQKTFNREIIGRYAVGLAFLLSAAPIFWIPTQVAGQHVRNLIWYASFLFFFVAHPLSIRKSSKLKKVKSL